MQKLNFSKVCLFVFMMVSPSLFSQIRSFDKLEMLYSQGHYKMVYRKANLLLDKPDLDFSMMPKFYKSLSLFQLSQNEYWLKHHSEALNEARELFLEVKNSNDGSKIFNAHINELIFLKSDMMSWIDDLMLQENTTKATQVQTSILGLFDKIPSLERGNESKDNEAVKDSPLTNKKRNEVVAYAKKQIGVPYVWAGVDPSGFDCSGFTGYVMKKINKSIPRRAVDQEHASVKVKRKNAQMGDLIFFDNGSGVSHVGIIVSEKGAPLKMIHASSSKGVIITDLETSEYWLQRIYSFGTFIE
jgi:cell wall-associated NlpC family hydrolase